MTKKQNQPEKLETVGENQSFEIILEWSQVEPVYQKVLKQAVTQVKMPGFRKGKAPAKIAENKLDQVKLINLTLQELLPKAYVDQIKSKKIKPLTEPEFKPIKLEKNQDWVVEAVYAIKPEINLKDYQKIVKKAKKEAQKTIKEMEEKQTKQAKSA
ncbi:MAG: hypothetical protein GF381_02490, partial [Candidatus Pacebacteria bacterium]|nr:hypothetical protein [Candidatus Paceibacterota bacterium]